jgi:DNA-binding response OmpR family regulator
MMPSVLVVEDERKIRDVLRSYLEHDGMSVLTTDSGAEAISLARSASPDLILLDLRLPDIPGEEVAREIRAFSTVPIIMLTAKTEAGDRIHGLELGADDYVTKPFSPREVVLRVRAILRRTEPTPQAPATTSYGQGHLVIDEPRHEITVDGTHVDLTATEWGLLTALANTAGRVFTRAELINRVRGYEFDGYERTIDTHIKNLRRKLEPSRPVIETVVGVGYRLALTPDRS